MAKRILVVDDAEQNRMLLRDVLEYFGYEVAVAGNGEEGVRLARETLPDLILMDMNMPVMDGYTALRIIRSDPRMRGIRVAAITSFAVGEGGRSVLAAGADGYIPKPIDIRALPAMVEKILAAEGGAAGSAQD
jgi:CheY-like chemotaxis protein